MLTKRLGNSGFDISSIGLGAWAIGGGDWAFGWGAQDDAISIRTILKAVDAGINWIDTAAVYGLGHSEEIVGRALRQLGSDARPRVFTKCGLIWGPSGKVRHHLRPDSIRREVEDSLARLGVERLDLYQIHWPSYPPGSAAPDLEEAWSTLVELKAAGKVEHIGVSNFNVEQMERIRPIAPVLTLQPPFSLLARGIEAEILPYCRRHHIGVIVYSPMKIGLLSGKMTRERIRALPDNDWRRNKSLDFLEPRLSQNLRLVERMKDVGRSEGLTPAQIAIAWTLREPAVAGAIVGARSPEQIDEIARGADCGLDAEDWARIEDAIPACAP